MPGTLYLLPNRISDAPIETSIPANVKAQAQRIEYFLVEAAKTARQYLKALEHPTPLMELNIVEMGHEPSPELLSTWLAPLEDGHDMAIVSESGCPGIADPGAICVAWAQEHDIPVVPLVGPSSILLTLMASGLDGQRFSFVGYLPQKGEARIEAIRQLEKRSARQETQLFIETPYRNNAMLESLLASLAPTTRVTVATDVTGPAESIRTRTVKAWKALSEEERTLPKLPTVFALLAKAQVLGKSTVDAQIEFGAKKRPPHAKKPHRTAPKKPF